MNRFLSNTLIRIRTRIMINIKYQNLLNKYWSDNKIKTKKPIIKMIDIDEPTFDAYAGYCITNTTSQWITTKNIRRATCQPVSIHLRIFDDKNKILPEELVLSTFLHELSHSISPVCQMRSKYNKKWETDHHSLDFYKTYSDILKWTEEKEYYEMTYKYKTYAKHCSASLKRYDDIYLNTTLKTGKLLKNWISGTF